ncbi:MAG: nucleotidyl transferase AbiEii/AbiGii toxin family protein [Balneolales bacterium]|nr:nucleotidyl transferase AbiEii/AbiGii toxin family protein [Balneolales bacterium]
MNLHENQKLFTDAIRGTAAKLDLPEIFIEKDYWVTYMLKSLFQSEVGPNIVFKGGTALSKCHGLIERFSEDIDLAVVSEESESSTKVAKRIRAISKEAAKILPEVEIKELTSKHGNLRKTAHEYKKEFKGDFGQVRNILVVEVSTLGNFEPSVPLPVDTFIRKMIMGTAQQKMIEEYGLEPFTVNVLHLNRTLCEKIMSLVRFSFTEQPIANLKAKIRHTYDLHKLLGQEDVKVFFNSEAFDELINKVGADDVASFRSGSEWLKNHPSTALIYENCEPTWKELQSTYENDFSKLVYGELPGQSDILTTLVEIHSRLVKVHWNIIDSS